MQSYTHFTLIERERRQELSREGILAKQKWHGI